MPNAILYTYEMFLSKQQRCIHGEQMALAIHYIPMALAACQYTTLLATAHNWHSQYSALPSTPYYAFSEAQVILETTFFLILATLVYTNWCSRGHITTIPVCIPVYLQVATIYSCRWYIASTLTYCFCPSHSATLAHI